MGDSVDGKNISNVIGGYKATLSNDSNSDEAKQNAQDKIEELEQTGGDGDYKPE